MDQQNEALKGLWDTHSTQSVAETRLEQAMSNTMDASAEKVQSIKNLCCCDLLPDCVLS